jgi:hypothetical protein
LIAALGNYLIVDMNSYRPKSAVGCSRAEQQPAIYCSCEVKAAGTA